MYPSANLNYVGFAALLAGLPAFVWTVAGLRRAELKTRWICFAISMLFSAPAALVAFYYLHVLPEWEWFYAFRAWRGSEFAVIFLGVATAAFASLLPRYLLAFPLFAYLLMGSLPYLKPLLAPLPAEILENRWKGDVCIQSTGSTCGAACAATILKLFSLNASKSAAARAAFTTSGGT